MPVETAPLLFGKMPSRADFVRRGPRSPAVDAFDSLVQRARRPNDGRPAGPLYRMVFQPAHGPDALVGAVQVSEDSVGRSYPLLVARQTPRNTLDPESAPNWPLWWSDLTGEAALIVGGAVARGATMEQVEARVAALVPVPSASMCAASESEHAECLNGLASSELWWRTWATTEPGRAALVFHRLATAFRRSAVPSYGLRLPLPPPAPDFGHADAAAFWLRICATLGHARRSTPTVFWHGDGIYQSGALLLFPSGVTARSLAAVLCGSIAPDMISDVDSGSATVAARALDDLPSSFAALLSDPGTTTATLLQHVAALT